MTRVLILHPELRGETRRRSPEQALEEATGLVAALDVEIAGAEVVTIAKPTPGKLFGEGKVDEIADRIHDEHVDVVVIDGPLSPIQQRNLERAWKAKVLDRTGLILEIFGDRARTREGVLQVELAHLTYQKSRLVRSWTHLERQRGGAGFMGGPGETQIEADRRAIDNQILSLERRLEKVGRTRALHRAARKRAPYPIVALVGYTNAGKSTLFNRMTEAGVLAKDMLFATLDPTMRAIVLPGGRKVILSDTVGFVSDLPTQLVAAFRATLEEVLEADLILHVRDCAHEDAEAQRLDVLDVLEELGVGEDAREAMIEVRNKVDLLDDAARLALFNETGRDDAAVPVSAVTGEGVQALLQAAADRLGAAEITRELALPVAEGAAIAWLHDHAAVEHQQVTDVTMRLTARADPEIFARFAKRFPKLDLSPPDVQDRAAE